MRSTTKCSLWAILLTVLMLASTVQLPSEVAEEIEPTETTARQSSVEAACEGLTFEDMFNYTHAIFDITVNDDWASADVSAVAWINGTLSDQVRVDLESFFEGLPGGDGEAAVADQRCGEQQCRVQQLEPHEPGRGRAAGLAGAARLPGERLAAGAQLEGGRRPGRVLRGRGAEPAGDDQERAAQRRLFGGGCRRSD